MVLSKDHFYRCYPSIATWPPPEILQLVLTLIFRISMSPQNIQTLPNPILNLKTYKYSLQHRRPQSQWTPHRSHTYQEVQHTQQFPNLTDAPKDQFPEILHSPQTLPKPLHVFPSSTEAPKLQKNSLKHKSSLIHKTNPKLYISQSKGAPQIFPKKLYQCYNRHLL